ncbi:hypothetical protein SAMN04487935_2549 [Flavobacterium noncentrifugens]|uniref:Uncharacterized protein n=1 Tax=Flavobacterium noncentrifugens TaxID=1128970 RepID=A0A1G8Z048_9FLAO|nr:hypothetical protein SAMN04487935_2549 [Flavobacterium noncentrifugens]
MKHSKVTKYFIITENKYFGCKVIGNKKQHKTLLYLFRTESKS